jgi:hypothetical protein
MKIEKGMYVKTDEGKIGTIISFYCRNEITNSWRITVEFQNGEKEEMCSDLNKYEPTSNIIDLIEVGDIVELEYYVAKYRGRISRLFEIEITQDYIFFENSHCDFTYALAKCERRFVQSKGYNVKIKSILTKEQIEQHSFKVGE